MVYGLTPLSRIQLTYGQDAANRIADTDDLEKKANFEHALLEEDSPYFEVRASVRNYDEDMPANTIRVSHYKENCHQIVNADGLSSRHGSLA